MDAGRLTEVIEELCSCRGLGAKPYGTALSECGYCTGTGYRVTRRTWQAESFNEQAAYATIKTLHAHIRKAAGTVEDAAGLLQQAGQLKQAAGMRAAAKAILEPTEGQD